MLGLPIAPLGAALDAGRDASGAVDRRWSRRQYGKTVEGGMTAVGYEPVTQSKDRVKCLGPVGLHRGRHQRRGGVADRREDVVVGLTYQAPAGLFRRHGALFSRDCEVKRKISAAEL